MPREDAAAARWPDLFREMRRAQDDMNRLLGGMRLLPRVEFPVVNVWAGADGAIVTAQIPGVGPEQVDITVQQDTGTLRGKRDPEPMDSDAVALRQERAYGPFARTVVPFRVDADKVSARCDRGVLTVELPRPEGNRPRRIEVAHG